MKTTLTTQNIIDMATKLGLDVKVQTSFVKITSPTGNRKAVYVARSKRTVTRVDFAGFTPLDPAGLVKHLTKEDAKELNLGAVRGQLLPKNVSDSFSESDLVRTIAGNLGHLKGKGEGFKLAPKAVEEEGPIVAVSVAADDS